MAKKRRDKFEPKKPLSAFAIFSGDMKPKIAQENPGIGVPELNKKISEAWGALEGDSKQEILDREAKQKEEYDKAMEAFKKTPAYRQYDALLIRLSRKGKSARPTATAPPKPAGMPNKPLPALIMFGKHVKGSITEQRAAWAKLSAEEKDEWQNKAKEADMQYQRDLASFNQTAEGKKYNREKQYFEKKQKLQMARTRFLGGANAPKEPKKPPSAYFIFVQEKRAEIAKTMEGASVGEVAKKLTEIWGKLAPDVKKEFESKAASLKATYDEELAAYKNTAGFKNYQRVVGNITGSKGKKSREARAKVKAKVKVAKAAKAKARGKAKAKAKAGGTQAAKAKANAGSASDSDVMGSDSDSDNSSSNSDSD